MVQWISRLLVSVVVVASIPSLALAWEAEGLRSGMPLAEVTKIMLGRGQTLSHKVGVGERKNAYMIAVGGGWLQFCEDVLYGWDRVLQQAGFEAFVLFTERETQRLGQRPTLQSISTKFELIATWDLGRDLLSYGLSKDRDGWRFSRGHEDTSLEQRCRR